MLFKNVRHHSNIKIDTLQRYLQRLTPLLTSLTYTCSIGYIYCE